MESKRLCEIVLRGFGLYLCLLLLGLCCSSVDGDVACYKRIRPGDDGDSRCKGQKPHTYDSGDACCRSNRAMGYYEESQLLPYAGRPGWFNCVPCPEQPGVTTATTEAAAPATTRGAASQSLWGEWREWSACTHTCGQGITFRTRDCLSQSCEEGSPDETRPCTVEPNCPGWGDWGPWSACTHTCGQGITIRTRQCLFEPCEEGSPDETRPCTVEPNCPVHGRWGDWSHWYPCTLECGTGEQIRFRTCSNPAPSNGGRHCSGSTVKRRACNTHPCAVNGNWGEWSRYSRCSVTCGTGTQERNRVCDSPAPAHGGQDCQGTDRDTRDCPKDPCAVNGAWSDWNAWSECSVTCGNGTKTRNRACDNPAPAHGGRDCPGKKDDSDGCFQIKNCPVNGGWAQWTAWGRCRARPCSGQRGYKFRSRSCTHPRPQYGGQPCSGGDVARAICFNNEHCSTPVNGVWCAWEQWSGCEVNFRTRKRTCGCPTPFRNGDDCPGEDLDADADCRPDNGSGSGGGSGSGSGAGPEDQEN